MAAALHNDAKRPCLPLCEADAIISSGNDLPALHPWRSIPVFTHADLSV